MRWNIRDPELYMFELADPQETIRQVAESAMRAVVARVTLRDAMGDTDLPVFHRAELGSVAKDYPDLVLAAVLGGFVAGRPIQRRAAALVAILATAYSGLLVFADMLPATVPLVIVLVLVEASRLARRTSRAARMLTSRSCVTPRPATETA